MAYLSLEVSASGPLRRLQEDWAAALACPALQVPRLCQDRRRRRRGLNLKQGYQPICVLEPSKQRDSRCEGRDERRRDGGSRWMIKIDQI
jgi:hypothetical protein